MQKKREEKIDLLIKDYLQEAGTPGIAVGVIEKGELVYAKGFGVMSLETNDPVTENTIFHMASVSKTFVATSIMQLVEKEKVRLDDPVIKHLPYFKIKGDGYETITIREMLSHISGMPGTYDYEVNNDAQYDETALEKHVKKIVECGLIEGQRGKFKYSDLAFEVLGDLISKVSGMSFENYIKENILNPIGMKESTFLNVEVNKGLLATPHCLDIKKGYRAKVSEVFPYNRRHAPSSALCSNIVEMFKWAKVNLNKGTIDGVQILKEESYLELFRIATSNGRGGYGSHIGLSWFLGGYKGNKVVGHSGSNTGFRSNLLIIPEKEIGLVWMTNSDFFGMKSVTDVLLDIVLGHEEKELRYSLATTLVKTIANDGIQNITKKYNFIKENCKEKYYNEEREYIDLAYKLYRENKLNEAIELLEIATKELPMADGLYDCLGELCLKTMRQL